MPTKRVSKILVACGIVFVVAAVIVVALGNLSAAKIKRPAPITPVRIGGIEFRAPNGRNSQGIVEAWDVNTKQLLWRKRLYRTFEIPLVEDSGWTPIKSMTAGPSGDMLIVVNSEGRSYVMKTTPPMPETIIAAIVVGCLFCAIQIFVLLMRGKRKRAVNN